MFKTNQEDFWAGQFGNDYSSRNKGKKRLAAKTNLFAKIIERTNGIESVIEYGANIGQNLIAMKMLLPDIKMVSVEINENACKELRKIDDNIVHQKSLLEYEHDSGFDFVLTKTVLIHIHPDYIEDVYDKLYRSSNRYICLVEYYNPIPVEVKYRGHDDKLFKRDFAGEMLDRHNDLSLIDYGFIYHKDPNFPLDDVNWFLLEKK